MAFDVTRNVRIQRDSDGVVRKIHHPRKPFVAADAGTRAAFSADEEPSARELADEYLREVLPVFELDYAVSDGARSAAADASDSEADGSLRYEEEKSLRDQTLVSYTQTFHGMRVWQSGITVKMAGHPPRVVGAQSSCRPGIEAELPSPDAPFLPEKLDPKTLARLLGLAGDGETLPEIHKTRLWVYPFHVGDRGNAFGRPEPVDPTDAHVAAPTLPIPELPDRIEDGGHYVAVQVLFSLDLPDWPGLHWGAFLEPETGAVLHLDAFVGCVDCLVYLRDPFTKTGDVSISPSAPPAVLDGLRDRVRLEGLQAPSSPTASQELRGDRVHVRNILPPNTQPPREAQGQRFDYSVDTDDFAAVNAYYHCDRLFRLVEEMGFDVPTYFDGTSFPVRVDHRVAFGGNPLSVNAQAPGNTLGDGSDGFRFAMVAQNTAVGMAVEWRVILHEFGHTILWDHVNSPNFRFAHSPGDSLAAILNDPDTRLAGDDRFLTFPWTPIRRRHDRRPEDGWGWGGRIDDPFPVGDWRSADRAGYQREQILSSTLFRLYRSLGGDHTDPEVRRSAAHYTAFLVFSAVGALNALVPPRNAEDFADQMMDADIVAAGLDGWAAGTAHKVVRWAFEQQGLYQPPGAPSPTIAAGAPPEVDIYLDDGRGGGYDPGPAYLFTTEDVWNRLAADGGESHQPPVADTPNFLYVRVRNRGGSPAEDIRAEVFHSRDGVPRTWPDQWQSTGDVLQGDDPVPSGGEQILGPLEWNPGDAGSITVLVAVSSPDDPSNLGTVSGPVSAARLAHLDNNIAGSTFAVVDEPDEEEDDSKISLQSSPFLGIPDADPAGVVDVIEVEQSGTVARVEVGIAVGHTWRGDLRVTLKSPAGVTVELFAGEGESDHDLREIFEPEHVEALGALKGSDPQGVWQLRVVDRVGLDVGILEAWSLDIELEED